VRCHPRHGQAALGAHAFGPVAAGVEIRVRGDSLAADLVEGDVLGRVIGGGGDRHGGEHLRGEQRGPGQRLHAAHGAADHGKQPRDAEVIDE